MIKLDRLARAARLVAVALLVMALVACGNRAEEQAATASAAAVRAEAEASEMLRNLDTALANDRPDLARAFGEDLLNKYPTTTAGRALAPRMEKLRAAADVELEAKRLRGLWTYHDVADTESVGRVLTAFIYATSANAGEPSVRLVLRQHASWGQSAYLLITDGDFACQSACSMQVRANDSEEVSYAITRAKDNVPPAVFVDNDADLLVMLASAKRLEFRITLAPRRETILRFEVGGFDPRRVAAEKKASLAPPAKPSAR